MKCTNCGREIDTSWKYCRYCGNAIISAGELEKIDRNNKKTNRKNPKKHKKPWIPITIIICLLLCVALVLFFKERIMPNLNQSQNGSDETVETSADIDLPRLDADTYFEERAEVISVVDAAKSASVLTEKQVTEDLTNRGFDTFPITSDYSMDGDFYSDTEINSSSSEKHPLFTTYYVSSAGEYWTIYEVNGSIIAYPVSYNLQSQRGVQLVVSESEVITSYDSESNQFYETIPNQNSLIVITVDRIDVESLDKLTIDVIDSM